LSRRVDKATFELFHAEVRGDEVIHLAQDENGRFEYRLSLADIEQLARSRGPSISEKRRAFYANLTEERLTELYQEAGSLPGVMRLVGLGTDTGYLQNLASSKFNWNIKLGRDLKRRLLLEEYFAHPETLYGSQTELAEKYLVSRITVNRWVQQALDGVFMTENTTREDWTLLQHSGTYGIKLFPGGVGRPAFLEVD